MTADPAARLRRAEELQAQHEGTLSALSQGSGAAP
ncbi:hypothetical protein LCGC14_0745360 [marine sediment metagenome]|uniref:Uncharacterized protein n=1 Tax=marine sediment metagenome TaxID=412755 RepID=A0A0F9TCN0_9ZZZZ